MIDNAEKRKPNYLINENSPYLLQHAYNPVNWFAWNDHSLSLAKKENKPIFLSIGYSSCHWCHVMAHESFEDEYIAKILNEKFVSIKVDREERPDIDDVYQRACQLVNGNGGWPLSVFLTPDLKPFYVGTYFPKTSRYGMPGFGEILNQLSDAYVSKSAEINQTTSEFVNALVDTSKDILNNKNMVLDKTVLDESALNLLNIADFKYGGFGISPKFPNVSNLLFLLRYYDISNIDKFKDFVLLTAEKIIYGGIHDHLGGGFSRYSTDQKWLVPHFEKMLYDNALLAILFCELYQITKSELFKTTVDKTLNYILKDLLNNDGGFFSAQDADSEGEEGKYYLWSKKEISSIIKDNLNLDIYCEYFDITESGNFEGSNILNIKSTISHLSQKYNLDPNKINQIIEESSKKLLYVREKRIKPQTDDKTILSWNSLAVSSFIKGYRITGNHIYLKTAINSISFVENNMKSSEGSLCRIYKNGQSKIFAYLDDYTFYINSLLDLFEIEPNKKYLELAIYYSEYLLEHFWDSKENNFYYSSDIHEPLLLRTKILYDLAIPSGNSIAISNFIRLYHLTGKNEYIQISEKMINGSIISAVENPFGFGHLLCAAYMFIKKPIEITLFSKNPNQSPMLNLINTMFLPNGIFSYLNNNNYELKDLEKYSFFMNKPSLNDHYSEEFALVCKDFVCSPPITTLGSLKDILFGNSSKERIK